MVAGLCDRQGLKEYMSTSLQYRCTGSNSICILLLTFPTPTLSLVALQITLSALGLLECTAYKYKGACTLQGIWTNRRWGQHRKLLPLCLWECSTGLLRGPAARSKSLPGTYFSSFSQSLISSDKISVYEPCLRFYILGETQTKTPIFLFFF